MKITRQGVRDLGGNMRQRRPRPMVGCTHVWESYWTIDCLNYPDRVRREHCGLCQAVRSAD